MLLYQICTIKHVSQCDNHCSKELTAKFTTEHKREQCTSIHIRMAYWHDKNLREMQPNNWPSTSVHR